MNNAEKFQETFGMYATEVWAMSEGDFLLWLNAESKSTEPEQRKKGHWVHKWYNLFYYCPVCTNPSTGKWDFCPNCGADMREDE